MTGQQEALFSKAGRALETARNNLRDDDPEAAVNRAYYAAFHAATAALLQVGESPKTHSGMLQRFRLHFIRSGLLPPRYGETLTYAYDLRQRADYEAFAVFEVTTAADLVSDVEAFVEAVNSMLQEKE